MMERAAAAVALPKPMGDRAGEGPVDFSPFGDRCRLEDPAAFTTTLLAIASHDLRQPLQVIVGTTELLLKRLRGRREQELLARTRRASTQLAAKLDLLVEALHLQEDGGGNAAAPVRLDLILDELADEFAEAARGKGIRLRIVPRNESVLSHTVLLGGMLRNLISNAINYTPSGGRVLVACRRRGTSISIQVRDSGAGIPAYQLANIFKAFHRLDPARSDGLGLGLFIVKRAADVLGHDIDVRSVVGRGSCFAIVAKTAPFERPLPSHSEEA
jgi:signal transduction histidine kinase